MDTSSAEEGAEYIECSYCGSSHQISNLMEESDAVKNEDKTVSTNVKYDEVYKGV